MGIEAGPGTEHVEPGAEAGLADHEGARRLPAGKSLGQPVGGDKHMLGLGTAVVAREVDIVEGRGVGCLLAIPLLAPRQVGALQAAQRGKGIGGSGHGGAQGMTFLKGFTTTLA